MLVNYLYFSGCILLDPNPQEASEDVKKSSTTGSTTLKPF